jgi:glycerol-3-phosphate acyltransferase PlsY
MIASVAAPIAVYAWGSQSLAAAAAFMAAVILIKHRGNICRLLAGKEPRIGAEA